MAWFWSFNEFWSKPAQATWREWEKKTDLMRGMWELGMLKENNERLSEENVGLKIERRNITEQNKILKKQMNVNVTAAKEVVLAKIIGLSADWLVLDKGAKQGIQKDRKLFVGESLVGIVENAGTGRAFARPVWSSSFHFEVLIGESKISALLQGQEIDNNSGFGRFQIEKIPQGSDTKVGDWIFVNGYAVGEITRILGRPSDPNLSAEGRTFLKPKEMEYAFIIVE